MKNYLSIDIGGTMIKYGILDEDANIIEKYETKTDNHLGGTKVQELVFNLIEGTISNNKINGICISTAGVVDCKNGIVLEKSPLTNNFGPIEFKKIVEEKFNLPCEIDNDVNCAGLAEFISGASKGYESSLCLTIGTGIGGSFILNGEVLYGYNNCACEVGYINVTGKYFQDVASTTSLVRNVTNRMGIEIQEINGKDIFKKAKNGDSICNEEIDRMCDYLGIGIANICCVLNPQIVVLGGGIMEQGEYLKQKIQNSLKKHLISIIFENTEIVFAKNGNKAGLLGAFYNFKKRQFL